jgi:hypothetical protein
MTLRQYVPISIGAFALMTAIVLYFGFPVLPFAVIALTGETLLGFAIENGRVTNFLKEVFRPARHLH